MARIIPDPQVREAVRNAVLALGSTTQERARRLGYTRERTRQLENGLIPYIVFVLVQSGIASINAPALNEPAPAKAVGE